MHEAVQKFSPLLIISPAEWSIQMATIPAGSPSLIDGEGDELDLNKLLVKNPDSTYAVTVTEDMPELGIVRGEVLIVDREAEPTAQSVVLIERDAYFAVKQFSEVKAPLRLVTSGRQRVKERDYIWGVVTYALKKFT